MLRSFRNYIKDNKLFYRDQKILLAVSGGLDSVVMLDLFYRLDMDCVVAHCNFNLRGNESDGDEQFVVELARKYGYPLFVKHFNTTQVACQEGVSIEMAARDLRYEWFEKLRSVQGCDYVAVAHHSDDVVETLFINLCRGTGIRGLAGIKVKAGRIVRPLLSFSRAQLDDYAQEYGLLFREDSTNAEVEFVRNKIRHQILPVLEKINPGIRQTLMDNICHFRDVEQIYLESVKSKRDDIVIWEGGLLKISIAKLKALSTPATYLYEFLSPYNFPAKDINNIVKALYSIPGKIFYSPSHRLIRDREYFLVLPLEEVDDREYLIEESADNLKLPISVTIEQIESSPGYSFSRSNKIACIDAGKLKFPLLLRKWRNGDAFQPIGMRGWKKISDFFIDQKFSLEQKQNTWLLISGEDIVWVLGHRLDDRFKITPDTKRICKISLQTP